MVIFLQRLLSIEVIFNFTWKNVTGTQVPKCTCTLTGLVCVRLICNVIWVILRTLNCFFFQLNKNIIVQNGEIIYLFASFLLALTINFTALYSRRKLIRLFAKKFYVSSNNEWNIGHQIFSCAHQINGIDYRFHYKIERGDIWSSYNFGLYEECSFRRTHCNSVIIPTCF